MKKTFAMMLILLLLTGLVACQLQAATPPPPTPIPTATLTPIPPTATQVPTSTPIPPLNSPNGPPLSSIHMFTTLDGWGVISDSLLLTHDGGIRWFSVPIPGVTVSALTNFAFFSEKIAFVQAPAADGLGGQFLSTFDGGGTWQTIVVPFIHASLYFVDDNVGFAYQVLRVDAENMSIAIYQTLDRGLTWTQVFNHDEPQPEGNLPAAGMKNGVSFVDYSIGWTSVATQNLGQILFYRTEDSGRTWKLQELPLPENPGAFNVKVLQPFFIKRNQIDGFLPIDFSLPDKSASNRIFYTTHDSGTTWTPGAPIPDGGAYTFFDAKTGWAWGKRGLYSTTDGAQTWLLMPVAFSRSERAIDINFIDATTGWLLTADAKNRVRLYSSHDGGGTWVIVNP